MNVADQFQQIGVLIYQDRLEPILEPVTGTLMPAVEVPGASPPSRRCMQRDNPMSPVVQGDGSDSAGSSRHQTRNPKSCAMGVKRAKRLLAIVGVVKISRRSMPRAMT